jgi:ribonuclease BN (tRNA processing enzyme)
MRVLIVGIGDAFTRLHFGSSALVAAPQGLVLIDCPDLIHRALHDATRLAGWNVDAASIDDILLTHLHGDHCNGLESFGFYRRIARQSNSKSVRPRLHVSAPVAQRLWERLAPAMHPPLGRDDRPSVLEDYFDVRVLSPEQPCAVAGLSVRCRFTKHPVPTMGFLLKDNRATFGWSGDTPFERAHVDWLSQADLFVHESNVGPAHTPIESLNNLPEAIQRKIRLIHLPDDFPRNATGLSMLREGQVLEL